MEPKQPLARFKSMLIKMVKEDYFAVNGDFILPNSNQIQEKYKTLLNSINGFIIISDYTTGLYEYVSDGIRDYLGYDVSGYSNEELTNFIFSIIYEKHGKFMFDSLFPTVFTYFRENATKLTGTDYRYTCCVKVRNAYGVYVWYLIDTVIIQADQNGFPLRTLITCTNINQFKRDDVVYYNILKKNSDGIYDVMLEGTENKELNQYNLTSREIEIINLIGQGYSNKQIADKLFIAINTVQTHRKNILKKTKCKGTAELTNFAFNLGLL